jgi:hypothetical protein
MAGRRSLQSLSISQLTSQPETIPPRRIPTAFRTPRARKAGKDIEPRIYLQMGANPSVTMMHRSDSSIDQASKDRYRTFLAGKVNRAEPTAVLERADPGAADDFYELAGTWLRENTRDTKKFPILFNELVTYGFRRNLLGVKWPALAPNVAVVLICAALLWYLWPADMAQGMTARIVVVLIVAAAHAFYFLVLVSPDSVKAAARTYARQLILSCETFLAVAKPAPKAREKSHISIFLTHSARPCRSRLGRVTSSRQIVPRWHCLVLAALMPTKLNAGAPPSRLTWPSQIARPEGALFINAQTPLASDHRSRDLRRQMRGPAQPGSTKLD